MALRGNEDTEWGVSEIRVFSGFSVSRVERKAGQLFQMLLERVFRGEA